MSDIRLEDIDWNLLWQRAVKTGSRTNKTAGDWDHKAESFARRNNRSVYNRKFIAMLGPDPSWSVLDVGCGPGNLAIPLAGTVQRVTALDFSPRMLDIVRRRCSREGVSNLTTVNLSWTADWRQGGIGLHDVVIASRSLSVPDLGRALAKLNRFAGQAVAVTDMVGPGPFDPDAFAAVGREFTPGPDYIYTVNLLYQMGIHARVDFITLEESHRYGSFREALDNYSWMFAGLTGAETRRLEDYVRSIAAMNGSGTISLHPRHVTTWAFIRWAPPSGVAIR